MTKVVLKLQSFQDKHKKKKAMKIASGIEGLDSISMDNDMKLTATGDIDPVKLTEKLRKLCSAEIVSVGPEKVEKKTEDPKNKETTPQWVYDPHPPPPLYYYQHHHPMEAYYYGFSQDEVPTACVIC